MVADVFSVWIRIMADLTWETKYVVSSVSQIQDTNDHQHQHLQLHYLTKLHLTYNKKGKLKLNRL